MPKQEPSLGRIVTYRTQAGVDIAAMITGLVDLDGAVHLEQFPPAGGAKDVISYQYGAEYSAEPRPQTWRWPDRSAPPIPPSALDLDELTAVISKRLAQRTALEQSRA